MARGIAVRPARVGVEHLADQLALLAAAAKVQPQLWVARRADVRGGVGTAMAGMVAVRRACPAHAARAVAVHTAFHVQSVRSQLAHYRLTVVNCLPV